MSESEFCPFSDEIDDEGKTPPHAPYLKPGPMRGLLMAGATGLGTGYSPAAPGTVGTLLGVALFFLIAPPPGMACWGSYLAATLLFVLFAIETSTAAESVFRQADDQRIVIDEVAGYLVTMMWVPRTWELALTGFVLFRFFDIFKFGPIRRSQSLRNGWGVVADDVLAGIAACLCIHILRLVIP